MIWVWEQVLAIETTWTLGDSRVQTIEVATRDSQRNPDMKFQLLNEPIPYIVLAAYGLVPRTPLTEPTQKAFVVHTLWIQP